MNGQLLVAGPWMVKFADSGDGDGGGGQRAPGAGDFEMMETFISLPATGTPQKGRDEQQPVPASLNLSSGRCE